MILQEFFFVLRKAEAIKRRTNKTGIPAWKFAALVGILGWILDAFDFFIIVFLISELMAKFQVGKGAIVCSMMFTLAMRTGHTLAPAQLRP